MKIRDPTRRGTRVWTSAAQVADVGVVVVVVLVVVVAVQIDGTALQENFEKILKSNKT